MKYKEPVLLKTLDRRYWVASIPGRIMTRALKMAIRDEIKKIEREREVSRNPDLFSDEYELLRGYQAQFPMSSNA